MSRAPWIALVVVLLAGCGGKTDLWHVERASGGERAELQAAADEWCDATAGGFCPVLVDYRRDEAKEPSDKRIVVVAQAAIASRFGGDAARGMRHADLRFGATIDETIWISNDSECTVHEIALHEFGHAAGIARHVLDDPNAIMAPTCTGERGAIQPSDLEAYCQFAGCQVVKGAVDLRR